MSAHPPLAGERRSHDPFAPSFALRLLLVLLIWCLPCAWKASAQVNGVGQRPYLGWSTFSEQTINGSFLTQANMERESDALKASGLQSHGFNYINIDSG